MQFEYKAIDFNICDLEDQLNILGKAGWELVGFAQCSNEYFRSCAFKRVLQNTSTIEPVRNVKQPSEFRVVLTDPGSNRISVIKAVREITGLALKEAKELVDAAPTPIITGNDEEEALAAARKLKEVGAVIEFQER